MIKINFFKPIEFDRLIQDRLTTINRHKHKRDQLYVKYKKTTGTVN